jgi:hypothetical protein
MAGSPGPARMRPEYTLAEEAESGFRDAVKRSEDRVRHIRSIRAEHAQVYQEFFTSIREQFGKLSNG